MLKKNNLLLLLLVPFLLNAELKQQTYGKSKQSSNSIQRIQIFGERCSGTNFLEKLLKTNVQNIDEDYFYYGWKHFPCWFDFPCPPELPKRNYTLENNQDCLFIIIFRDPYNWLRSLHSRPYHATHNLHHIPFAEFIRAKWTTKPLQMKEYACVEINPKTKLPFANILQLRTARIVNMLKIQDLVPNYYMINYETLSRNPQEVLEEISRLFGIELEEAFRPVVAHLRGMGKKKVYKGSSYPEISAEDLQYINRNLNWALEKKIGYEKKQAVPAT